MVKVLLTKVLTVVVVEVGKALVHQLVKRVCD